MNADAIVKFESLLAGVDERDLITFYAMQQSLAGHVLMAEAARRGRLRAAGWKPNAPGLVCHSCGGQTWGKQVNGRLAVELVKCDKPQCRTLRTVVL